MNDYTEETGMRVAIDAHAIGQHLTGNEVYIRSLLWYLAGLDTSTEFLAYVSTPQAKSALPAGVKARSVSNNPFLRLGWNLTSRLKADRPDVLHVQYTGPLGCHVPLVVSVHDVSFLDHPEFFTRARAMQLRLTVRNTVRDAARILTPSEFSRREIERHYPEARGKTEVAYNAVPDHFRPVNREQAQKRVWSRFGIEAPFLLNVGDLQPRKNQSGLIQAFEELVRGQAGIKHRLVLVGQNKWAAPAVKKVAERSAVSGRIHFTGYVTDEELRLLYNACDAFVFPSFYEGFGIPILEAMACGCPVACSKTSAMPEVADGASIFFDPYSIAEMTRAMRDLILDGELRQRLGRLGQNRAAQFSWGRTAEKTLEVYRAAAGKTADRTESARAARSGRP